MKVRVSFSKYRRTLGERRCVAKSHASGWGVEKISLRVRACILSYRAVRYFKEKENEKQTKKVATMNKVAELTDFLEPRK